MTYGQAEIRRSPILIGTINEKALTYLVTLKTLRSLSALKPDRPKEPARGLKLTQNTSNMEPKMTTQSNLLKAESK